MSRYLVIIIFDEFEKAHPALQKLLLVSLDKGTIQTASNRNVDLSNAVILFTSNIGNQIVERKRQQGAVQDPDEARNTIVSEMGRVFPPEFRGRVNDVIIFNHLSEEAALNIAKIKIGAVNDTFRANGVNIDLSPTPQLLEYLAEHGNSPSEGARAIIKLIDDQITQDLIAAHSDFNIDGREIIIDIDEQGKPAIYFGGNAKIRQPEKPATDPISGIKRRKRSYTVTSTYPAVNPATTDFAIQDLDVVPIETLRENTVDALETELTALKTFEEERGQTPLVVLTKNVEYIFGLKEKILDLREYLKRRSKGVTIESSGLFSIRRANIILTVSRYPWGAFRSQINEFRNEIHLDLAYTPDIRLVLDELTKCWDRGNEADIRKFAGISRERIVKTILKSVQK